MSDITPEWLAEELRKVAKPFEFETISLETRANLREAVRSVLHRFVEETCVSPEFDVEVRDAGDGRVELILPRWVVNLLGPCPICTGPGPLLDHGWCKGCDDDARLGADR